MRQEHVEEADATGVEILHGQVGLPARVAAADPPELAQTGLTVAALEDVTAEVTARFAETHALADADQEAGDLLVAEYEAPAGSDAFVALEDVIAVRAGRAVVGMRLGRLPDGHREREGVALRARRELAAVAGAAVPVAPSGRREAIAHDRAAGMPGAFREDERAAGLGFGHALDQAHA